MLSPHGAGTLQLWICPLAADCSVGASWSVTQVEEASTFGEGDLSLTVGGGKIYAGYVLGGTPQELWVEVASLDPVTCALSCPTGFCATPPFAETRLVVDVGSTVNPALTLRYAGDNVHLAYSRPTPPPGTPAE